jgi:hypothetical protein
VSTSGPVVLTTCALGLLLLAGCAKPYDYTNFRQHRPRSILVAPPQNESQTVNAAWSYQSTVTRPLAERGYYVFPVDVVDRLMKENAVSPSKAAELLGADAVLYVTLEEYATKQQVLNAATLVKLRGQLVDARSGVLLWERRFAIQHNSNLGSGGIPDSAEAAHDLAGPANVRFFGDRDLGLLYGPYHPRYGKDE